MFRAAPSLSYTRGTSSRLPSENVPELRSFSSRRPSTFSPRKPCSVQRPAYRTYGARLDDFRRKTSRNSVLSLHDVRQRLADFRRKMFRNSVLLVHTSVHVSPRKLCSVQRPAYRRHGAPLADPSENVPELRSFTSRRPSTFSPRKPCSVQRPAYRRHGARLADFHQKTFRNSVLSPYDVRQRFRLENHVPCSAQPIVHTGHV